MSGATRLLAEFLNDRPPTETDIGAAGASWAATRHAIEAGRATAASALADRLLSGTGGGPSAATEAWRRAAYAVASGLDDTLEYGSAGAPVWPALEAIGGDDMAVVDAGARGMLAAQALWTAGRYHEPERGYSGSTAFGVLAAAGACARLLRLDAVATVASLAIAASHAGGLVVDDGTDARMLRIAAAARDGLQSALLARDGFQGAPDMIEGRQGFGEAFFGLPLSQLPDLPDSLARASLSRLTVKTTPGHEHHQKPVATLAAILAEHVGRAVREVRIEGVPPTSDGNRFAAPRTPAEAARSLRHALGVTVERGRVTVADLESPLGLEALARVVVRSAPRWDPRLERLGFVAGDLEVEFEDGGVVRVHVD